MMTTGLYLGCRRRGLS